MRISPRSSKLSKNGRELRSRRSMPPKLELTLTPEEKRRIRASFAALQPGSDSVAVLFYGRMFDLDPSLRGLFKTTLLDQARKLMDTLATVVDALDRFDTLRPQLAELGRKHVAYGTEPRHYVTVKVALVWALKQALGQEFDGETRSAWESAIDAITRAMLAVCEEKAALLDFYTK